jgi:hypothetical protein
MNQVIEWIWQRPARAFKVYYKGSRSNAITEKCIECACTLKEAKECEISDCALWCFRPGATKGEVPSFVPPQDELQALADAKVPDAVREHARKMGNARKEASEE